MEDVFDFYLVLFLTFSSAHFDSVCGEEQSLMTTRVKFLASYKDLVAFYSSYQ